MALTARDKKVREEEAALRLARFERLESWEGLEAGDPVRITGHRGGLWLFQAFVTNTSNGASWVEVAEVVAASRRRGSGPVDPEAEAPDSPTRFTRPRSFRPEQVQPLKKRRRGKSPRGGQPVSAATPTPASAPMQGSFFEPT